MVEIKHKKTGKVIFRIDAQSLVGAKLAGVNLGGTDLQGIDLTGADLRKAVLTSANLREAVLNEADLREAVLNEADLQKAHLSGTRLGLGADLRSANLEGSTFEWADLNGVDLRGALLRNSRFHYTNLSNSLLESTDFTGSRCSHVQFDTCLDLRTATGLETIQHTGASSLDAETLRANIEHLPDVFLEGVGYSQEEIDYLRAFYRKTIIEYYSCYISYSHKDEEFAKRLHSRLQDANVRVWYAPEDMVAGSKLHDQIDDAIRLHDRVLLILSENSIESEWVRVEIRNARWEEVRSGKRKLFPLRLTSFDIIKDWSLFDSNAGKDLAMEIREYFIPDFSEWKDHDRFESSFAKLLKDLKNS